jgi:hypothetical protein
MLQRILVWSVRAYVRGPARSWLYTTAALWTLRLVRRSIGRRPVVETLSIAPGQTVVIEHLEISHKRQMKEMKRSRRLARRLARRSA